MNIINGKEFQTNCNEEDCRKAAKAGDWQVGCKDIKMRMVNLYYSDSWVDCTFLVGPEQLVSAHKVVLAAASPVFAAMFFGGLPEHSGPIQINDIEPDTFIEMLRYIYTDNTDIITFNDACALYYTAKKYMLLHLKTECLDNIVSNLSTEDCCSAYEFAQLFDEKKLMDVCIKLMEEKTKDVLASSSFLQASLSTVQFIYSLEKMELTHETDLFEALVRYVNVNNECGKTDQEQNYFIANGQIIESTKIIEDVKQKAIANGYGDSLADTEESLTHEVKTENDEIEEDCEKKKPTMEAPTIRHIVKLIRFLAMTAEEFTNLSEAPSLLTQAEILAIVINIVNYKAKVPMPEGFSLELKKRYIEDIVSRNEIKFRFIVPDCKYLQDGDVICLPKLFGGNSSWIVNLESDTGIVRLDTSTKVSNFVLRICIYTKQGLRRNYQFDCLESLYQDDVVGEIDWQELMEKYLENGALCLDVEIEIRD